MQGKFVRTRVDNGVGYIEIAKPRANTYDLEMMHEVDAALEELRFDDHAKVIVLTSPLT